MSDRENQACADAAKSSDITNQTSHIGLTVIQSQRCGACRTTDITYRTTAHIQTYIHKYIYIYIYIHTHTHTHCGHTEQRRNRDHKRAASVHTKIWDPKRGLWLEAEAHLCGGRMPRLQVCMQSSPVVGAGRRGGGAASTTHTPDFWKPLPKRRAWDVECRSLKQATRQRETNEFKKLDSQRLSPAPNMRQNA